MSNLKYGVAYYDEYMPYERLEEDIKLMKEANINVVRIAESTWSTLEPQEGIFDFTSIDRVLDAMNEAGLEVIVGTPTYAVPTWLVKMHPDVLAITKDGPGRYGARQIMDITNPAYLHAAKRMIRQLISHVVGHPAVIGFQVDNETKHYGTAGENVQLQFVKYIRQKYQDDLEQFNHDFGLNYWSNRINAWEDFPSMVGTINGSLGGEFSKFQRQLVTDFLKWQVELVNEYKLEHQFVTHNFDFEWRGHSYGVQPDVNHFEAAKPLDITGIDVYHPSQEKLTGAEISYAGDIARSTKGKNYLVLETQAQAFKTWTPFPGQLRLQAFSHIASGANMVEYWHWHSIHNSAETYWKGLLSHDFKPNPVYNEAKVIGREFKKLSKDLVNLKITNRVAILISNESLTAIDWFPYSGTPFLNNETKHYNDLFRLLYDELYKMNVGVDVINPENGDLKQYDLIVVPALYTVEDAYLESLNDYVKEGGNIIYTFKSGFADERVKVRTTTQPGMIHEACGISYQLFVQPENVNLQSEVLNFEGKDAKVYEWMELIEPTTAKVLAKYQHPYWGKYAAITKNTYGKGTAVYVGCFVSSDVIRELFEKELASLGINDSRQEGRFPIIIKRGINENNQDIYMYLNYSDKVAWLKHIYKGGTSLLNNKKISTGDVIKIEPWDLDILMCSRGRE